MPARTYDAKEVQIIVGGQKIQGFAQGAMIRIKRNEDAWSLSVGVDGEGSRSKSNNFSASIELELQQTSDSNEYLSGLAIADEVSNSGIFPLLVKDSNGTSIYAAETAWIKKLPDSEFNDEIQSRVWMLETDNLQVFVGKN